MSETPDQTAVLAPPVGGPPPIVENLPRVEVARPPFDTAAPSQRLLKLPHWPAQLLWVVSGFYLFVLGLQLLHAGTRAVPGTLAALSATGAANALGAGWLLAYFALSGSPVAATSLALFGGGVLDPYETFAMINGSRLGAAFIVLAIGTLYFLRNRSQKAGLYVGVLALVVTVSIYLPAMLLGSALLRLGWLDGIQISGGGALISMTDLAFGPLVRTLETWLATAALLLLGWVILIGSFRLFDRALPELNGHHSTAGRLVSAATSRPLAMFALGLAVTFLTLSVSVSLGLLVPLVVKGYASPRRVVPYIMGANITTFVDTLFASLLVAEPLAFSVVLSAVVSVSVVSLLVLGLGFRRYNTLILKLADLVTSQRRALVAFVAVAALVPLLLFLS